MIITTSGKKRLPLAKNWPPTNPDWTKFEMTESMSLSIYLFMLPLTYHRDRTALDRVYHIVPRYTA